MTLALHVAARSDVGLVRSNNQDSAYAGSHLLVVADGMGGAAGGDIASSLAIGELASLDGESHGADDALAHLAGAIRSAHHQLLDRVAEEPGLSGMGTTVTALLRTGSRFALAHIGDSRAYLLRDGELSQITRDHTFVQHLVDDGRLTPEEASHHPQRSVLMRVLSDIVEDAEADLSMREARRGDRYLLCSDGLSSVVSHETLEETLAAAADPDSACAALVQLALRGGAPDNVTCIVADVVDVGTSPDDGPFVVGAVAKPHPARTRPMSTGSAAERAAALTPTVPAPDEDDEHPRRRFGAVGRGLVVAVVVALVVAGAYGAWRWTQGQYYVAAAQESVAIYRGLPQDLGPLRLSTVDEVEPDVPVAELPDYARQRVEKGIVVDDRPGARSLVTRLRALVEACRAVATPTTTPSTTPSSTPSSTPSGGATTSPGPSASVTPSTSVTPATSATPSLTPSAAPTTSVTSTTAPTVDPSPTGGVDLPDPTPEDCGGLG